jgi:hypothetical protein
MANKTIDMSKIRQILRFFTQGKSKVFISQQTGASRNTVKRYIRKFLQEKLTFEDISGMPDADLEVLFVPSRPPDLGKRYDELQRILPDLKRFKQRGVTIVVPSVLPDYRRVMGIRSSMIILLLCYARPRWTWTIRRAIRLSILRVKNSTDQQTGSTDCRSFWDTGLSVDLSGSGGHAAQDLIGACETRCSTTGCLPRQR